MYIHHIQKDYQKLTLRNLFQQLIPLRLHSQNFSFTKLTKILLFRISKSLTESWLKAYILLF